MNALLKIEITNRKPILTIENNSRVNKKEIENGGPPTPMASTCSTLAMKEGKSAS